MDISCLVGNGSSLMYNPELGVGPLTKGIINAFTALAKNDAGDALAAFARRITGDNQTSFEGLLGPFDTISQALPLLAGVAGPFAEIEWIADPLNHTTKALHHLHQLGIATALKLIANRSQGQGLTAMDEGPGKLVNGLLNAAHGGRLTVGTLNYDGLLQSAFPNNDDVADLASGLVQGTVNLAGQNIECWSLRTCDDIPDDRAINLLHLHGSLGWIRLPDGSLKKVRIDDLRRINFWDAPAEGKILAQPVVVLTDRKVGLIETEPFSLAYRIFRDRMITTSKWCIAGYNFTDLPVNNALVEAVANRHRLRLALPNLLILGYEDPESLRSKVTKIVGTDLNLFVDGSGMPNSIEGDMWQEWVAS